MTYEELILSLPERQRIEREVKPKFEFIEQTLERYKKKHPEYTTSFSKFTKSGDQYIANFEVKNPALEVMGSYNWHLQNTSQWVFAGCLLMQDGKCSICT